MKNTQHTPGPWKIEREDHAIEIQCNAFVIGDVFYEEEEGQTTGPKTRSEAISNARLIAASPELLSALEDALEELKHASHIVNLREDVIAQCKAVLANAKGDA